MPIIVYGIPNCDTVKKARRWLDANGVEYTFHNYKQSGIDEKNLKQWCKVFGWETVLNKRGTTWRKLPDNIKNNIDEASAIELMQEQTSLIKRPVVSQGTTLLIGFKEADYEQALQTGP